MPPFFTQPCIFKRPQLFLLCVAPLEVNAEEFLQVWQGVAGQNQPNFCAVMWPFFPPEEGWIQQGTSWLSGTERPSKTCFLSGQVVSGYLDAAHTPQVHPWSWMLHHASTWNSSNQTIDKKLAIVLRHVLPSSSIPVLITRQVSECLPLLLL